MISDGQRVRALESNAAWMSRTSDTSTVGVVELDNTTDPDSGATVENTQQAINETFDAVGMLGIDDASRNNYSSNEYITNGDDRKEAIGKLDAALKADADDLDDHINTVPDAHVQYFHVDGRDAQAIIYLMNKNTEGAWRIRADGNNLYFEMLLSSVWTVQFKIERQV